MIDRLLKGLASADSYGIYQLKMTEFKEKCFQTKGKHFEKARQQFHKERFQLTNFYQSRLNRLEVKVAAGDQQAAAARDRLVAEFERRQAELKDFSTQNMEVSSWEKVKLWCKAVFLTTYSLKGYMEAKKRAELPESSAGSRTDSGYSSPSSIESTDGGHAGVIVIPATTEYVMTEVEKKQQLEQEQKRLDQINAYRDCQPAINLRFLDASERAKALKKLQKEELAKLGGEDVDGPSPPVSKRQLGEIFREDGVDYTMIRKHVGGPLEKVPLLPQERITQTPVEPGLSYLTAPVDTSDETVCAGFMRDYLKFLIPAQPPLSACKDKFVPEGQKRMANWFKEVDGLGAANAARIMREKNPQDLEGKLALIHEAKESMLHLKEKLRLVEITNQKEEYARVLPKFRMAEACYLHMIEKYHATQHVHVSASLKEQLRLKYPQFDLHYRNAVHVQTDLSVARLAKERFEKLGTEESEALLKAGLGKVRSLSEYKFSKTFAAQLADSGWVNADELFFDAVERYEQVHNTYVELAEKLAEYKPGMDKQLFKAIQQDHGTFAVMEECARGELTGLCSAVLNNYTSYKTAGGCLRIQELDQPYLTVEQLRNRLTDEQVFPLATRGSILDHRIIGGEGNK